MEDIVSNFRRLRRICLCHRRFCDKLAFEAALGCLRVLHSKCHSNWDHWALRSYFLGREFLWKPALSGCLHCHRLFQFLYRRQFLCRSFPHWRSQPSHRPFSSFPTTHWTMSFHCHCFSTLQQRNSKQVLTTQTFRTGEPFNSDVSTVTLRPFILPPLISFFTWITSLSSKSSLGLILTPSAISNWTAINNTRFFMFAYSDVENNTKACLVLCKLCFDPSSRLLLFCVLNKIILVNRLATIFFIYFTDKSTIMNFCRSGCFFLSHFKWINLNT